MSDLAAITDRLVEIDRLRSELDTEQQELLVAKRVLERLAAKRGQELSVHKPEAEPKPVASLAKMGRIHSQRGHKWLYTTVLTQCPSPWLTANEVRDAASALKGADIPMSSVSPQLTDLKNEGVIVRDGLKVALAERVAKTNGASATGVAEAPKELPEEVTLFREAGRTRIDQPLTEAPNEG